VGMLRETHNCEYFAKSGTMCAVHATGVEWPECCNDLELAKTLLILSCETSTHIAGRIAKAVDSFVAMHTRELEAPMEKAVINKSACSEVLSLIERYGGIDGAQHKQWVLDQIVRILAVDYDKWVAEYCNGNDGPDTYEWDTGVPP